MQRSGLNVACDGRQDGKCFEHHLQNCRVRIDLFGQTFALVTDKIVYDRLLHGGLKLACKKSTN